MKKSILILFSDFLKNYCTQYFFLIFLLFSFNSIAQGPGCPNVNAGEDIELDCEQPCTNLSATFLQTGVTTSYEVSPLEYQPPFPTTGGTEVSVFIDDKWSNIIPLPFDFCFYGGTYSEMLIGSNGVITFDTLNNQPNGWCEWSFSNSIPSTNLFNNTIFGPYMDIDPSISGTGTINYTIFGDAPCRTMVVNFPNIPYYSSICNQYTLTTQIVIYETTNVIEIYLEDRTDACPTWNNGNAVIGLQNQNGTNGITPPERNTGNWSATNEAWRFTPNGESNITFSWLSEDSEIIGTDPIVNVCPTNEVTTYTAQAIYTNCNGDVIIETDEVTITFPGVPSITDPISDYQLCDNDGDGSETFDLTSKYDEIVNTLTDITLTYYNTEEDANTDINAIAIPESYSSEGAETIWVRAINIEGCISVGFFNLIIDTAPLFTEVPLFQICDDTTPDGFTEFDLDSLYPTIVAGASNLTVSYYLTEVDAEAGTGSPLSSPYTNTINPQLIWARVEDDITGCYGTFAIELNVISPIAGAPTPLIECDQTPNDGIAEFNLTEADTDIINGQTNNLVTYHETLAQAEAGTDALVSPYTNTVPNTQTIFARLEEDVLGCYDVTQLVLQVDPAPSITDPISDYQLCDNDGDGSETFDLTSKYDEIVNTLTDITLTYYNTEADANADTNAIATPSAYISSGTETIWVSAINTEGCTSVGFFNLIIDTVPLFTEVPLFQICDDTTPDGFTEFDLDSLYPTIVAGASNLTVSYYLTEEDAEAGAVSPLSSPYTNTINPELIWARVEDDITGCYGTFVIELNVISPLAGAPTPLIECDQTPNDGIAEFNLTEADTDIINGQTNNLVTYHETLAQAEAGTDALVSPYTNTVPNTQTIFARLEEDVLGCYDVTQLVLQVDPAPSITDPISDYQLCDNDGDGSETFDLTSKYDEIVNTLTDITLTYYNTEADANADTNAIATPSAYISSGTETIWVSAINTEGCTSVGFFNLIIDTVPLFTEVPLFQICDDTTPDGFTEFDLDSLYPTIVAGASNLTVSYYLTEVDAEAGAVSPLSSPYTNTINPELIWARVEDDITGCYGTFVIELNVISPLAGAPTPLIECDQTPNDGIAEFNLTEADTDIINGQTNNLVTYHETLAQAEAGTDALVSPYTNTVPNTQTIFARLEEDVLGCYDVTQLVLQVDPAPSITDPISDYQLCDNDGDGSETFDLTSKYDEIVNTLTDVTLTYYSTEADANADTNAIVTTSAYISSGTETIWVRLSDNFTQCYTIGNFQIETIFCPLPDATVSINNDLYACRNRDLIIEYRVNNIDGTAILPAFTPISFYLDEILVTQTQTLNDIPINGSETNSIEINLPINTPNLFDILIRVDDLGFSEGIIEELDELNNEYSVSIEFGSLPPILPLSNLIECDEGNESANFNLTQQNNSISTNTNDIITFYISEEDANLNENEITDTGNYQNTSNPQTIYIRLENEICFTTSSFEIETENCIPLIPEGFSPNNDNINDVFEIDHLLNVYLDFELKIFSRYGNIIYKGTHEGRFLGWYF